MTRVPTYVSHQLLTERIQNIQKRLNDSITQTSSRQKSQDYLGLSTDTFRLITLETACASAQRYQAINVAAEVRVKTMAAAVEGVVTQIKAFTTEVKSFGEFRSGTLPSREYEAKMRSIQQQAANALSNLHHSLNVNLNGRFLFSGGATDRPPVSLPTENDRVFRSIYNGNTVTFPETRGANLFNSNFRDLDLTFGNASIGTTTYGEFGINVGAGESSRFVTGEITNAGALTYSPSVPDPDPTVPEGSITSSVAGAFSGLTEGMSLLLDASGTASGNDGVYTVTEVSADGRVIKTTPPVPSAATDAAGSYALRIGVPNTAAVAVENSSGNNAVYTVRWPSNADLRAAGVLDEVLRGEKIFTTPPVATTGDQGHVNIVSRGYYQGDTLETLHRLDQNRALRIGVNAADGAMEKAVRALGLLAQDFPLDGSGDIDLKTYYQRLDKAVALLQDSREHQVGFRENPSDLKAVSQRLGLNELELHAAQERTKNQIALFEDGITNIENVDLTETIVRLNENQLALDASLRALSTINTVSLLDYI